MDAITLLKADHKNVEKLFKDYEKTGDRAFVTRRDLVDRMIEGISVHTAIEEQAFYPATLESVPSLKGMALESLEEHNIVKWLLAELEQTDVENEHFDAKVTVLMNLVRHHVEEEENDYFPEVRDVLGRSELAELGEVLEAAKERAPTHPHPRSPSTPPGNWAVGSLTAVTDRTGDVVSGLFQGGIAAVRDLMDRVRGVPTSRSRPTGTSTARQTATAIRERVGGAVDDAASTVGGARKTGQTTVEAARSAVEDVAETARKRTQDTAETAKRSAAQTRRSA